MSLTTRTRSAQDLSAGVDSVLFILRLSQSSDTWAVHSPPDHAQARGTVAVVAMHELSENRPRIFAAIVTVSTAALLRNPPLDMLRRLGAHSPCRSFNAFTVDNAVLNSMRPRPDWSGSHSRGGGTVSSGWTPHARDEFPRMVRLVFGTHWYNTDISLACGTQHWSFQPDQMAAAIPVIHYSRISALWHLSICGTQHHHLAPITCHY